MMRGRAQNGTGFAGDMTEGMLAGDLTGFSQADSAAVNSVASLGGTAAQAGFEYMAFENTSINVLNTRDFGFAPNQAHGLFALTFDKEGGMGISTLNDAIAGWDAFVTQTRIRWYDATGGPEVAEGYQGNTSAAVAFRANYSFGDDAARAQLEGFLSGDITLRVGAVDDRKGKTTIEDGVRVVDLLSLGLEGDVGSQLHAATVLQWEAHRDGKIGNAQQQFEETVRASFAMQGMAQVLELAYEDEFEMTNEQQDLVNKAREGWEAFAGHVAGSYDFSEDNWKYTRTEDGFQRTWDGNHKMNLERFDLDEGQQEFMTSIAGKSIDELTEDEMAALQEILVLNGGDAEDVAENLGLLQDVSRTRYHMTDNVALYSGSEVGRGNEFATDGTTDFVRALHRLRQSGIMTLNGANVVAESNGVALTELDDETILPVTTGGNPAKVTTLYGDRLWPGDDPANPLFGTWSSYTHSQVDIGGAAMVVAHDEGDATLRWDDSFGLRARLDGETYYTDTGHLGAESLDDWIAAAMTDGTTVELTGIHDGQPFQSDGLRISGLPQAAKLGNTGNTGYSFGIHADVEYGIVDAFGDDRQFDPAAFWGEQGLVAASGEFASYGDFYITPYAAQYSGLPSLQSVRNSGSIVSGDAGAAFEKLIQYYDNQQFANDESRVNQFIALMGQVGHDSLASADRLFQAYPGSSIASLYNDQWSSSVMRNPHDPQIQAELLRWYMMMQENR